MIWSFVALPLILWIYYRIALPNQRWEFDFDVTHATFFLLYDRYSKLAVGIIIADLILAWFCVSQKLQPFNGQCFGASAVYAGLWVFYTLRRYENYLHNRYPRDGRPGQSPYTTAQYALTLTLANSSLFAMATGILGLVAR